MDQTGGNADFPEKAAGAQRRCQGGAENLDGYEATVLQVPGEVDGGHPSAAELTVHRVVFRQDGAQAFHHLFHSSEPRARGANIRLVLSRSQPSRDDSSAGRVVRGCTS